MDSSPASRRGSGLVAARRRLARLAVLALWLAAAPALAAPDLDDLLVELRIVPMGDQAPPPFALPTLNGGRLSLDELRGGAALLYFWESG